MRTTSGSCRALAALLAVAAALTATACGASGDGGGAKGAARPSATSVPSTPSTAPARTSTPPPSRPARGPACTGATTEASVAEDPHGDLMLTATNTSGSPCVAFGAPRLRFGDATAAVAPSRDTAPGTPVTLGPGESAYAGILSAWEPDDYVTVDKVSLTFAADAEGRRAAGAPETVALPRKTPYEELDAEVTYWQRSREDAHADG
ncbi:DUF4232 domain-containing protein [Streptomyces kanamyceticus]|uniref:DUF4232 domain-containing protein n=1 Tax=Streptomyces kanamyceticus TaxID=1967 RepID=A0A5J6GLJ8_STRKN|nr:DUF4232 domain-containing protein [Streptomyces kanamyceticus]QEU96097.1 DUF4232 domain-containing protein [Streptomyces kanamyceticus]